MTVVVLCIAAQTGATSVLQGRVLYHKHAFHAGEDVHSAYNSRSKRSIDYCDAYFKCYDSCYRNSGSTYHSVCLARKKLKACKNIVTEAHPELLKKCEAGMGREVESMADYWCNKTNGFFLFRSYHKCPFVKNVIPLYKDFSPQLHIQYGRAALAGAALTSTGTRGYSNWQYKHKYSHPDDPVYKALSSFDCAMYRWKVQHTHIINKYCGGDVADIYWLFFTNIDIPQYNHMYGLVNWNHTRCTANTDPLEQVMQITQLQDYIKDQIQPRLGECHPNNVLVRGVSCLMIFYGNIPPFTDIKQFLPSMCKRLNNMETCWHPVVASCPGVNLTSSISNMIGIHQVVCDIGNDEGAEKYIALWADAFLARKSCQAGIQYFSVQLIDFSMEYGGLPLYATLGMMDCLIRSLHDMIDQEHENSSSIITQFKQLLSRLEELHNVIADKKHINGFLVLIDVAFTSLLDNLLMWMGQLITFFLVECQFVDYDPVHFPGFL